MTFRQLMTQRHTSGEELSGSGPISTTIADMSSILSPRANRVSLAATQICSAASDRSLSPRTTGCTFFSLSTSHTPSDAITNRTRSRKLTTARVTSGTGTQHRGPYLSPMVRDILMLTLNLPNIASGPFPSPSGDDRLPRKELSRRIRCLRTSRSSNASPIINSVKERLLGDTSTYHFQSLEAH